MSDDVSRQNHLILLLGGARAGKSAYALRLAAEHEEMSGRDVCFVATAQALDQDMTARIARHRSERPAHWQTIEEQYQIDDAIAQAANAGVVIIDCLTLFVSNWLLRYDDEQLCLGHLMQVTGRVLEIARSRSQTIICVSNEVGLGIVPETRLGRIFRDLLGRVNQEFARAADEVFLLVAGLPLPVKTPGLD
jgi:adenosylcobinamide kinase / adenosylcobinamide-phosphate guanylyltransferase